MCLSSGSPVHTVLWYFVMNLYNQSGRCQDVFDTEGWEVSLSHEEKT